MLEILPLAWFFYESDQAEHIYDQIQHQDQNHHTHCVHYLPDPFIEGNGRCQVYENRPFLCRMFGFSTRYDKVGSPVAVFCKQHKSTWPEEIDRISRRIGEGISELPNYQNLHYELYGIHPDLQSQRFPINVALKKAIEYLYFHRRRPDQAA